MDGWEGAKGSVKCSLHTGRDASTSGAPSTLYLHQKLSFPYPHQSCSLSSQFPVHQKHKTLPEVVVTSRSTWYLQPTLVSIMAAQQMTLAQSVEQQLLHRVRYQIYYFSSSADTDEYWKNWLSWHCQAKAKIPQIYFLCKSFSFGGEKVLNSKSICSFTFFQWIFFVPHSSSLPTSVVEFPDKSSNTSASYFKASVPFY